MSNHLLNTWNREEQVLNKKRYSFALPPLTQPPPQSIIVRCRAGAWKMTLPLLAPRCKVRTPSRESHQPTFSFRVRPASGLHVVSLRSSLGDKNLSPHFYSRGVWSNKLIQTQDPIVSQGQCLTKASRFLTGCHLHQSLCHSVISGFRLWQRSCPVREKWSWALCSSFLWCFQKKEG